MRFILDENLPPKIAAALSLFHQPVVAAAHTEAHRMSDPALIRFVGEEGGCLISRDRNILHNPASVAAIIDYRVGLFLMHEGEASDLELARVLFRAWPDILHAARQQTHPFCMFLHATGTAVRPHRLGRGRD